MKEKIKDTRILFGICLITLPIILVIVAEYVMSQNNIDDLYSNRGVYFRGSKGLLIWLFLLEIFSFINLFIFFIVKIVRKDKRKWSFLQVAFVVINIFLMYTFINGRYVWITD